MKISASVPDDLWARAQYLGDGPSEIVQEALRRCTREIPRRGAVPVSDLDPEAGRLFEEAVAETRERLLEERRSGFRFGLTIAKGMTADDAELIANVPRAVDELRELIRLGPSMSALFEARPSHAGGFSDQLFHELFFSDFFDRFLDDSTKALDRVRESLLETADEDGTEKVLDRYLDERRSASDAEAAAGIRVLGDPETHKRYLWVSRSFAEGVIDALAAVWAAANADDGGEL